MEMCGMFHIAYICTYVTSRKYPVLPSLVPVTNVGLVVLVTLSDAAPQVTENNPLPTRSNKICQGI